MGAGAALREPLAANAWKNVLRALSLPSRVLSYVCLVMVSPPLERLNCREFDLLPVTS
jgi:hypothetical protein